MSLQFRFLVSLALLLGPLLYTQGYTQSLSPIKGSNKSNGGYQFTIEKEIGVAPVQSQAKTNTCWSFSTTSFLESEVMRIKKEKHDISVMFFVRKAYEMKADKYVRMGGKIAFAEGGEIHDVLQVLKQYGAVPQEIYTGLQYGEPKHAHFELEAVLKGYLDGLLLKRNGRLSTAWKKGLNGILDAYLGVVPSQFVYKGKSYTPVSWAEQIGLNADNYVELTSFTHHPFNQPCVLEVSDNWSGELTYNITLPDFLAVIDNAVTNDYSVAWATDVSEKYFSHQEGIAIVPDVPDLNSISETTRADYFKGPKQEKTITQELRQAAFDSQETTDDHGMHIFGKAKDQAGTPYYLVKNSWGTDRNELGGIFYASKAYVAYKTTFIAVHKSAIPTKIAEAIKVKSSK